MSRSGSREVLRSRSRASEERQGHNGKGTQHASRQADQQTIHSNRPLFLLIAILCHKNYVGLHSLELLHNQDLE